MKKIIYFTLFTLFFSFPPESISGEDCQFDINDFEKHPEKYLVVAPSSIPGNSGDGVYVREKLPNNTRCIPKGTFLPYEYWGEKRPLEDIDKDYLDKIKKFACLSKEEWTRSMRAECKQFLKKAKISFYEDENSGREVENLDEIDWAQFQKTFSDYSFDFDQGATKFDFVCIYPENYTKSGNIYIRPGEPSLSYLHYYINEPPPTDFINLLTKKKQVSRVSLKVRPQEKKLRYKTLVDVYPGEELFISYGHGYHEIRKDYNYKINMSLKNGAFQYSLIKQFLNPGVKREAYEKAVKQKDYDTLKLDYFSQYFATLTKIEAKEFDDFIKEGIHYKHPSRPGIRECSESTKNWFERYFLWQAMAKGEKDPIRPVTIDEKRNRFFTSPLVEFYMQWKASNPQMEIIFLEIDLLTSSSTKVYYNGQAVLLGELFSSVKKVKGGQEAPLKKRRAVTPD